MVAFLNRLATKLEAHDISLTVIAGSSLDKERFSDGLDNVRRSVRVKNYYWGRAYWQCIYPDLRDFDLVITRQGNLILLNYALFLGRWFFGAPRRLAYIGHGTNFQMRGFHPIARGVKRAQIGLVDHWFAYTRISEEIVRSARFPAHRITTYNNSTDVADVADRYAKVATTDKKDLRKQLGLAEGPTAVTCSRLYADKRPEFLLEAARKVRRYIPDFQLVIIGDGALRKVVEEAASTERWIVYVGAIYGEAKARYLVASDVMAIPSAVGLSILDAFAAGLPLVTADFCNHGPEIAYLEHGVNGVMSAPEPEAYATALIDLLRFPDKLAGMASAARSSAETYSVDNMVERFSRGILTALAAE
jgi:glycosyltransferase involved in cell wall biosynthesis